MPIYLTTDQDGTRATTHPVMAALERFVGWMLFGPRQHDRDLRAALGPVSPASLRESTGKRS